MNQSVIIGDELTISHETVGFYALSQGMKINCSLSFNKLNQLTGEAVTPDNAEALFERARFDIEDIAEKAIKNQCHEDNELLL
ncbi:DUF1488 family protein [Shewanella gaetbuli]